MGRLKKEVIENVAVVEKIKATTKNCPYCKSEAIKKIKDTDTGALYSCGCGNRCQL